MAAARATRWREYSQCDAVIAAIAEPPRHEKPRRVTRAGLWKRGGSLRGADDQPRLTASSARSISLICQRTRASGRLRTRLPCGAGGGRQATHRINHLRRAILLIRLA